MNKTIKISLIALGAAAVAGAAYYFFVLSGSAHLKYVPKEAAFVGSVNLKSLASKVDLNRLKKMNMYKEMVKNLERSDDMSILAQVMDKPEESGINLFAPVYFYATQKNGDLKNGGMVLSIKSAKNFEKMLRKSTTEGGIEKDDKYQHVLVNNEVILGWNDNAAVFVFADDKDDLEKDLDNAMVLEKSESILAEEKFDEFIKKDADAGLWMNYAELAELSKNEIQTELLKQYGLDNAALELLLNFEEKKVAMAMNVIYDDKTGQEVVNILNSQGLSEEHLKTISPENIYAIFSASVNFKELVATLSKNKEFKSGISEMKDKLGLSNSDLESLLTGEMSLSVIDFDAYTKEEAIPEADTAALPDMEMDPYSINQNPYHAQFAQYVDEYPQYTPPMEYYGDEYGNSYVDPYEMYQPAPPKLPGMVLSLSAKNPGALERILKKMELTKDESGIYSLNQGLITVYIVISKTGLIITNNKDAAEDLAKRKEFKTPAGAFKDIVTANPMALWVDMDVSHYPKKLMTTLEDQLGKRSFDMMKERLKPFTGFEMIGSSSGATFALNMTDDKKSSLMRILEMMDEEMN